MQNPHLTTAEFLARVWLAQTHLEMDQETMICDLRRFAEANALRLHPQAMAEAERCVGATPTSAEIGEWITFMSMWAHPHTVWHFAQRAVDAAETDEHLHLIALNFIEPLLSLYGSMIDEVEAAASRNPKLRRMLSGSGRHMMSDRVWTRLLAQQALEPEPLFPLKGDAVETGHRLRADIRRQDDMPKARYARDPSGDWILRHSKEDA